MQSLQIEGMDQLDKSLQDIIKNLICRTSATRENQKTSRLTMTTLYKCDKYKDKGFILTRDTAKECECAEQRKYEAMLERSGISKDFLKIRFREFDTKDRHETVIRAKSSAIDYFKNFIDIKKTDKNSITFLSKNIAGKKTDIGTGKTHLSIAIANNIMKKYKIGTCIYAL